MEKLFMDWNTIRSMWFYDFQNTLETFSNILKDRKEQEEKEAKEQGYDKSKMNPNSLMKQAGNYMPKKSSSSIPKMPSMPKF